MDSIYCHINGTDHQNDPAVRNGSFIRMRHIIIPQINLLGFGFMAKRVILYRIKPQKPEYFIKFIRPLAVFKVLSVNDALEYPYPNKKYNPLPKSLRENPNRPVSPSTFSCRKSVV